MGKPRSSGREGRWGKVFNALRKMLKNLQSDRQILEDRVKLFRGIIVRMMMEEKMGKAKAKMEIGLKEREAFVFEHKYEDAESELSDFRECFDYLSQKYAELKDLTSQEGHGNEALQNEIRKLRAEIKKCNSEKASEISALLAEKNFIWNQFKTMETDFSDQLRRKSAELEHSNGITKALMRKIEDLQSCNEKLRTDVAKSESELSKKSEEISRLLEEIKLVNSNSRSVTPVLRPCSNEAGMLKSDRLKGMAIIVKKELGSSQGLDKVAGRKPTAHKSTGGKAPKRQLNVKGSSSSKRKAEVIAIPDTPKLFTSSFKVPKLKN